MNRQSILKSLLAVIVLYRRSPAQSAAYQSLVDAYRVLGEVPSIFLHDNSPQPLAVGGPNVYYSHEPNNHGVSLAYNRASIYAREQRFDWLLLLDQDTRVTPEFIEALSVCPLAHPESVVFVPRVRDEKGLLSPFQYKSGRGKRITSCPDKLPLHHFRFINSGLVVSVDAFLAANGYDERIPLDFSDISFGKRLQTSEVTDHFRVVEAEIFQSFFENEVTSSDVAFERFRFYQKGALAMAEYTKAALVYSVRVLMRACKLSVRHRSLRFISQALRRAND